MISARCPIGPPVPTAARLSRSMGVRWRSSPPPEIRALTLLIPLPLPGGRHRGVGAASGASGDLDKAEAERRESKADCDQHGDQEEEGASGRLAKSRPGS